MSPTSLYNRATSHPPKLPMENPSLPQTGRFPIGDFGGRVRLPGMERVDRPGGRVLATLAHVRGHLPRNNHHSKALRNRSD